MCVCVSVHVCVCACVCVCQCLDLPAPNPFPLQPFCSYTDAAAVGPCRQLFAETLGIKMHSRPKMLLLLDIFAARQLTAVGPCRQLLAETLRRYTHSKPKMLLLLDLSAPRPVLLLLWDLADNLLEHMTHTCIHDQKCCKRTQAPVGPCRSTLPKAWNMRLTHARETRMLQRNTCMLAKEYARA